jgi:hypothetical protein
MMTNEPAIMESVIRAISTLERKVIESLADYEKVIEIRFSHVDAMIGQIRDDNREFHKMLLDTMTQQVENRVAPISQIVSGQDDKLELMRINLDDATTYLKGKTTALAEQCSRHETRIVTLEQAPDKHAAEVWRGIQKQILTAIVAVIVTAGIGYIGLVINGVIQVGVKQ